MVSVVISFQSFIHRWLPSDSNSEGDDDSDEESARGGGGGLPCADDYECLVEDVDMHLPEDEEYDDDDEDEDDDEGGLMQARDVPSLDEIRTFCQV